MTTQNLKRLSALLAAASLAACGDLNIPDLNNPSLESFQEKPTRAAVIVAATGLLIGHRVDVAAPNGYVAMLGILGREAYNFDAADPRFVTEMLAAPQLDPGSPRFGGNFWLVPYANIRNANLLLNATDRVQGMTNEELEGVRGFAKTIQALDFLVIANTRDDNGAVIDVNNAIGTLGLLTTKSTVFGHIARLLDEGRDHLRNAGATFVFPLDAGFQDFNTPDHFREFNRAVKARVDVYQKDFEGALENLDASFLDDSGSLDYGAYVPYGTGSGDTLNGLVSPNLFAHPSIVTNADRKLSGAIDDRVTRKIKTVGARTVLGLTSDLAFNIYPTNTTPVPIIRNEELILLRAEAYIGTGDIALAADDINLIRVESGGLAPRLDLDADNILDELLKQKRYSLLFEGGHRWIDMRRYNKLEQLGKDLPSHSIHARFPIPIQETDARK
jgi:starch-binding outer membrane protein, SusD/RagB family